VRLVAIAGSPRKKSNTAKVLGYLEDFLGDQLEMETIRIASHHVNGCLGCNACAQALDRPGCIQEDDAVGLLERLMAADFVLYSSPLYCWGFTSQIKSFIDRHYCMVKGYGTPNCKSLLEGKPIALLVTCGGPIENNADLIQEMFERFSSYGQCKVVGKYIVPFSMDPVAFPAQGMETAKTMAADILASMKI
jgi:multimeric flavodoxin WrbA